MDRKTGAVTVVQRTSSNAARSRASHSSTVGAAGRRDCASRVAADCDHPCCSRCRTTTCDGRAARSRCSERPLPRRPLPRPRRRPCSSTTGGSDERGPRILDRVPTATASKLIVRLYPEHSSASVPSGRSSPRRWNRLRMGARTGVHAPEQPRTSSGDLRVPRSPRRRAEAIRVDRDGRRNSRVDRPPLDPHHRSLLGEEDSRLQVSDSRA